MPSCLPRQSGAISRGARLYFQRLPSLVVRLLLFLFLYFLFHLSKSTYHAIFSNLSRVFSNLLAS